MAGIGIALGGVAKGLESAERARIERDTLKQRAQQIQTDADLRARALDIQEKQEERLSSQQLLTQADKIIGQHLEIVGQVIKAGRAAGRTDAQIAAAVQPLLADIDRLASATGRDAAAYARQVAAMFAAAHGTTFDQMLLGAAPESHTRGRRGGLSPAESWGLRRALRLSRT